MNYYFRITFSLLLAALLMISCQPPKRETIKLLVFSKTAGYRHQSIGAGQAALFKMAAEKGFQVDTTEDASLFTEENLAQYSAVVFLNTTQDVLDYRQQADFERYIQSGGGFVGIHAATDTEYQWPWYNQLVGAYFKSHPGNPNVRTATMKVVNKDHISTSFLPDTWERTDEFYNFRSIYEGITPLIEIDETTYEGGENGDYHPMTWYHAFDGGRSWYTNFGHTDETFSEPEFLQMLWGGIQYAVGENLLPDYKKTTSLRVPDENRFVMEVLDENLYEPAELEVLPDGRVLFTGRRGTLSLYDPVKRASQVAGQLLVYNGQEDGLMGIALDPNFAENKHLYMFYSPAGETPVQYLSRFDFVGDSLLLATEKVVLEVPVQRNECCHAGGSVEFGPDGLLYLSVGDDTNPFETAYAPIDERPGKGPWDAQKSSGSPGDLRGKVLRIRPLADGTYEIPAGNLFPADGSQGRPEIYVMGCRNPYRISIDPKRNFLYWGEVGPDAQVDSSRGPRGYDEVNQARKAGFFGWPYFVGNNYPYRDVDFATQKLGDWFDPAKPVNTSPNNKGPQALPPAQPAFIWYPYAVSPDFPIVGTGGRNAMAGPTYYYDLFAGTPSQFPKYYDGKLLIYDFMRDWILAVTMNQEGDLQKIEPFLPAVKLSSPIDMQFGPDGALYILEYGTRWFAQNRDARLIRIDYKEGNRAPVPEIAADKRIGAAPMTVNFTANGSRDYDAEEELSYRWEFPDGTTATGLTASHTFSEAGIFEPKVIVSDKSGASATRSLKIQVGNEPPQIDLSLAGNQGFFWSGKSLNYAIDVVDQEEGSVSSGKIPASAVAVSFDYLDNSQDGTIQAQDHAAIASASMIAAGKELITSYGCIACHDIEKAIQGPAYNAVAQKYENRADAMSYLAGKILNGGIGVWGEAAMPAQVQVSQVDANKMASFVLSLTNESVAPPSLPLQGKLAFNQHKGMGTGSVYTLQISYTDKGGQPVGPLEAFRSLTFRSPQLRMTESDQELTQNLRTPRMAPGSDDRYGAFRENTVAVFKGLDLSGISAIDFNYAPGAANAQLEVRSGATDGPLLGTLSVRGDGSTRFRTETVSIQSATGKHDLYLVVKGSEGATVEGPLVKIFWMYFQPPQSS